MARNDASKPMPQRMTTAFSDSTSMSVLVAWESTWTSAVIWTSNSDRRSSDWPQIVSGALRCTGEMASGLLRSRAHWANVTKRSQPRPIASHNSAKMTYQPSRIMVLSAKWMRSRRGWWQGHHHPVLEGNAPKRELPYQPIAHSGEDRPSRWRRPYVAINTACIPPPALPRRSQAGGRCRTGSVTGTTSDRPAHARRLRLLTQVRLQHMGKGARTLEWNKNYSSWGIRTLGMEFRSDAP